MASLFHLVCGAAVDEQAGDVGVLWRIVKLVGVIVEPCLKQFLSWFLVKVRRCFPRVADSAHG